MYLVEGSWAHALDRAPYLPGGALGDGRSAPWAGVTIRVVVSAGLMPGSPWASLVPAQTNYIWSARHAERASAGLQTFSGLDTKHIDVFETLPRGSAASLSPRTTSQPSATKSCARGALTQAPAPQNPFYTSFPWYEQRRFPGSHAFWS